MTPEAYCLELCRRAKSNFLFAMRFLKRDQQAAMRAFYAFCKEVDEAADAGHDGDSSRRKLAAWRLELDRIYLGSPEHPIGKALAPHLQKHDVPKRFLEEIINGCAMDIEQQRYKTFAELELYCYRVASCVGLVSLSFFGIAPTPENQRVAEALGKALQLTNILRDFQEDAARGRCYLPEEDRQKFPDMGQLVCFEIARARGFFHEAFSRLPTDRPELRKWLAPLLMGRAYERLLDRIEQDPLAALSTRVAISRWQKLKAVGATFKQLYLS